MCGSRCTSTLSSPVWLPANLMLGDHTENRGCEYSESLLVDVWFSLCCFYCTAWCLQSSCDTAHRPLRVRAAEPLTFFFFSHVCLCMSMCGNISQLVAQSLSQS